MPPEAITKEALIALFEAKAMALPPESSIILARHLQCKESLTVARILTEAMNRYAGDDSRPLAAPRELLPPLG
jgi:hypothetical protein